MLFWTDSIKEFEVLLGVFLAFCWISRYCLIESKIISHSLVCQEGRQDVDNDNTKQSRRRT